MRMKIPTCLIGSVVGGVGLFAVMSGACAQEGHHQMLTPADIKWSDVPSLPPGAKIAVLEGKMGEAAPFTCDFRQTTRSQRTGIQRWNA